MNLEVSLNSMLESPRNRVSLKFSIQLPLARLPTSPSVEKQLDSQPFQQILKAQTEEENLRSIVCSVAFLEKTERISGEERLEPKKRGKK